jgi:hypothetical protein
LIITICCFLVASKVRVTIIEDAQGVKLQSDPAFRILLSASNHGLPRDLHQHIQRGIASASGREAVISRSWLPPTAYQAGKDLGFWACAVGQKPVQLTKAAPDNCQVYVRHQGGFGYAEELKGGRLGLRIYDFANGRLSDLSFPTSLAENEERPATVWSEWNGYVLYSPHRNGAVYALKGASLRFKCAAKSADVLIPGANVRCDLSGGWVKISSCSPPPSLRPVRTVATVRLPRLLSAASDGQGHIALLGEEPRVLMAPGRRLILLDTRTGRGSWFTSRFFGPLHWNGSTLAHYYPLGERDMRVTPNLFQKPLPRELPSGTPLLNWEQKVQAPKGQTYLVF